MRAMGPDQKALVLHMLQDLETPSRELTKWEEDFIASVTEAFSIWHNLTERQFEILDRIYAEKTS
jgi:hypothetical protein